MDGGAKRAWGLYSGLASVAGQSELVGRRFRMEGRGKPVPYGEPSPWRDRKLLATFRALLSGRDYWQQRHLGPAAHRAASEAAARLRPNTVVLSFLLSFPLLAEVPGRFRLIVDTHNYDPAFFEAVARATRNPLARCLCRRTIRTAQAALRSLPQGTVLTHVSEADAERHRRDRPDLEHRIIENGTTVAPRQVAPDYAVPGKRQLLFVASLSSRMNHDALVHFQDRFWPALRDRCECRIVGSNPSHSVRNLCERNGWRLSANVADEELERIYGEAHFCILPFGYGEGSKLKLFEACGRGVPALATRAGMVGVKDPPPLLFTADDGEAWRRHVESFSAVSREAFDSSLAFARRYSWPVLAERMAALLEDMDGPVRGAELPPSTSS